MPFLGKSPTAGFASIVKDDLTPNGSTTAFTLSKQVANANDIAVFLGNVRQEPTDAYTVSGTTLTMSEAPASGLNFYVLHIAGTIESSVVPADNTISTAKIQNDAITGAKIENNPTIAGNLTVSGTSTLSGTLTSTGLITASAGMAVGGTGSANTLDDFEEGTFEVVITGTVSGTATGQSAAGSGAAYVKIGETVFYRGYFANPSISGTMDGSLRLALPFTNRNSDRFDNGSGGFIVGHREISSGTTSNEITLKTGRGENFARLRRKYTVNSRTEDTDLTQGNASINGSTLIWFQGTLKV